MSSILESDRAGEFFRFLLVGIFNTATGYGVFSVLHFAFGIEPGVANAWGYAIGLLQALTLNRWFVFEGARLGFGAAARFFLSFGLSFSMNQWVLRALLDAGRTVVVAQLAAMLVYTIMFFAMNRMWVWQRA